VKLALFDFDGTLTTRDTIWPLAICLSEGQRKGYLKRFLLGVALLKLKLGLISNHSFKERFLRLLVEGESEERIKAVAQSFHRTQLDRILNRNVLQRLLSHTAVDDDVYLVSSNFDFFLRPLQQEWNVRGIFATDTEVLDGKFTGRILGRACDGKEKLDRVLACLGERRTREAIAYGDSRSDSFLLDYVKTGHWVGPRRNLSGIRSLSQT
jgi:phosphatidylglycerophosphatase C